MSVDVGRGGEPRSLWEAVEERARLTPEAVLLADETGRRVTSAEFEDLGRRSSAWVAAQGWRRGDRVAWLLPSSIDAAVLAVGLSRSGVVQVPIVPIYRRRELSQILSQTQALALVTDRTWSDDDDGFVDGLRLSGDEFSVVQVPADLGLMNPDCPEPPPAVDHDQVRWIFFTSGSTAEPKGCLHSDEHLWFAGRGLAQHHDLTGGDCVPIVFPIAHIGGMCLLYSALLSGCRLLYVRQFGPDVIEPMRAEEVTVVGTGMPFFAQYLEAQRRLPPGERLFPKLRAFTSGGMPKPAHINGVMRSTFGAGVLGAYGMTEAPILTVASPWQSDAELSESEGRPVPGASVRIVTSTGGDGEPREEGEIRVQAPQVMFGYLDPDQDEGMWDAQGYLRTGDLGFLDEHGNVVVTGRLKDVIIRKGENISARELEDLLAAHDEVRDVAVIGVPDVECGERVGAVVVPTAGAAAPSLAALCQYLTAHDLAIRKLPEHLFVVEEIPRDPSGKIKKRVLLARLVPGVPADEVSSR